MKEPHPNLRTLYPFAQSKTSKALEDEDRFMRDHGGAGPRTVFLCVQAISVGLHAIFAGPLHLLLRLINYDHPLENRIATKDFKASIGARHRKTILKRSCHAKPS